MPADEWLLVEKGLFKDYQTTREQAAWIAKLTSVTRSHGCAFADSWGSVTFQRMPNVSLLPGEQEIGSTRSSPRPNAASWSGIAARGRSITSGNFQFSGQVFHEVRGGKITRMPQGRRLPGANAEFWNSMDMIGGAGSTGWADRSATARGSPAQSNSVSHGCPPARFPWRHDRQHGEARELRAAVPDALEPLSRRVLAMSKADACRGHRGIPAQQHALRGRRNHHGGRDLTRRSPSRAPSRGGGRRQPRTSSMTPRSAGQWSCPSASHGCRPKIPRSCRSSARSSTPGSTAGRASAARPGGAGAGGAPRDRRPRGEAIGRPCRPGSSR